MTIQKGKLRAEEHLSYASYCIFGEGALIKFCLCSQVNCIADVLVRELIICVC